MLKLALNTNQSITFEFLSEGILAPREQFFDYIMTKTNHVVGGVYLYNEPQ